jgi:hypothetical protein
MSAAPLAAAPPSPKAGHGPAWNRDLGRRLARQPTRREQKRFSRTVVPKPIIEREDLVAVKDYVHDPSFAKRHLEQQLSPLRSQKAACSGIRVSTIGSDRLGFPLYAIRIPSTNTSNQQRKRPLRVLVTARLHGDEPVGSITAMKLAHKAMKDAGLRSRFDLTILPMIHPSTHHNLFGANLNRAFIKGRWTPESAAIQKEVLGRRYDLLVDLHGDYLNGNFLLRGTNDGKLSRRILSALHSEMLLDTTSRDGSVPGRPYRFHSLGGGSSASAGTLRSYMARLGTPYTYTLEYDRTLAAKQQVSVMTKFMFSTLYNVERHGKRHTLK